MKKLSLILLVCSLFGNVTNNDATVTIGSDVNVFLDGNFVNNGTLTNEGYLEISGFFIGDGTLTNTGTFIFENVGDLNSDADINVQDIIVLVDIIINIFENEYSPTGQELGYGDIYQDGQLNVIDIVALVNIILEQ